MGQIVNDSAVKSTCDYLACSPAAAAFHVSHVATVLVTSGRTFRTFAPAGQRYAARAAFSRAARPALSSFLQHYARFSRGADFCIFALLSGREDALIVAVTCW